MATSMDSVAPAAPTKSSIISGAKTLWQWISETPAWIKTLSPRGVDSYGVRQDIPITDTANFALYSSSSAFQVARQGKTVHIFGSITCSTDSYITSQIERIFAQIQQEFQPSYNQYFLVHGGANSSWLLTVGANGSLSAARYSGTQAPGVWLPFSITYIVS